MDLKIRDEAFFENLSKIVNVDTDKLRFISENINCFTMRRHVNQNIAYYEIFKEVINVPGSIAEFGVYWGNSLFSWLNLLETFVPLDRGRKVFGFDDFNGYLRDKEDIDKVGVSYISEIRGNFVVDEGDVRDIIGIKNSDNVIPYDERCILYAGNITETINQFKAEQTGVRLCLANIDLNLKKPTKYTLENIWQLIVPGGIIIFRGYGSKPWEGESAAVDEFLKTKGLTDLRTISFNNTPGAYVKKIT
ncbi:TylF/MycF family methyltransferase [Amylibacter sp.]|nr:TylF/MycF family methyltransferase [Amylibacter sp.]